MSDALITVRDLVADYGERRALDRVSLEVRSGRFTALLGANGAGKSTLFSVLTGLMAPVSGQVSIAGKDLAGHRLHALRQIGIVFQETTLDLDLTALQNMQYFAALHGLSGKSAAVRIDAELERLSIADRAHEKVRSLNGGHRRRLEIARALVHEPAILLMDEPTVGLDAPSRREMIDQAHAFADAGLCILWATHLVDEVRPDDQVILLRAGTVDRAGVARDMTEDGDLNALFAEQDGVAP